MKASRLLIGLEIVVCFGPVLAMLTMGLVLFPVWLGMLLFAATNQERFVDGSGGVVAVVISIVLSLLGILGVIAIIRLYNLMWQDSPSPTGRKVTLVLSCAGLIALTGFNLVDGNLSPTGVSDHPWVFLLLLALPMICAGHMLYSLRAKLLQQAK
jgi:hypothetical protein